MCKIGWHVISFMPTIKKKSVKEDDTVRFYSCLYLKYTFTSRCRFMTPKQVSVTWELIRQMTPKVETTDQEYTMTFSNTLNNVRRIRSGKENLNVPLSYARHLFSMLCE